MGTSVIPLGIHKSRLFGLVGAAKNVVSNIDISSYDPTEPLTVPFSSTCLSTGSYNPLTSTLEVTFVEDGRTYEYYNVELTVWLGLQSASSIGRYFNYNIRNRYSYSEI